MGWNDIDEQQQEVDVAELFALIGEGDVKIRLRDREIEALKKKMSQLESNKTALVAQTNRVAEIKTKLAETKSEYESKLASRHDAIVQLENKLHATALERDELQKQLDKAKSSSKSKRKPRVKKNGKSDKV